VLVTGAGGFIGSHLAGTLVREGARVRGMVRYNSRNDVGALDWLEPEVREQIEVTAGDLRDVESVHDAAQGVEMVFHLGAQVAIPYSYARPREFFETNVLGSLNVAQAALTAGVERIVHTSTSEVYGTAQAVPITEQHRLEAQSPYAASKIGADKLMDSFHRSFGLPVTVIRPFNTYGPHQSARAVIPTIISQALAGSTVELGSLIPRRDLLFVSDTVAGFIAAATSSRTLGRTLQLGTGQEVSVGEIVRMVGDLLGRELEVQRDPRRLRPDRSEVQRLVSSPLLMESLTGWRAEVDLRTGLERTIAWLDRSHSRAKMVGYVV
jgi:dTDP-glucose 4,6-dehydratase